MGSGRKCCSGGQTGNLNGGKTRPSNGPARLGAELSMTCEKKRTQTRWCEANDKTLFSKTRTMSKFLGAVTFRKYINFRIPKLKKSGTTHTQTEKVIKVVMA